MPHNLVSLLLTNKTIRDTALGNKEGKVDKKFFNN